LYVFSSKELNQQFYFTKPQNQNTQELKTSIFMTYTNFKQRLSRD